MRGARFILSRMTGLQGSWEYAKDGDNSYGDYAQCDHNFNETEAAFSPLVAPIQSDASWGGRWGRRWFRSAGELRNHEVFGRIRIATPVLCRRDFRSIVDVSFKNTDEHVRRRRLDLSIRVELDASEWRGARIGGEVKGNRWGQAGWILQVVQS